MTHAHAVTAPVTSPQTTTDTPATPVTEQPKVKLGDIAQVMFSPRRNPHDFDRKLIDKETNTWAIRYKGVQIGTAQAVNHTRTQLVWVGEVNVTLANGDKVFMSFTKDMFIRRLLGIINRVSTQLEGKQIVV